MVKGISTFQDIQKLETRPLESLELPHSILDGIRHGSTICQNRDALTFLPNPYHTLDIFKWSYTDLIEEITQAAKGFLAISEDKNPVISMLLPNLPETYFSLYGAQSVGQANPINPLLEPEQIKDIMQAAHTNILVTLASLPGTDLFEKAVKACENLPNVKTIITVDPTKYARGINSIAGSLISKIKTRAKDIKIVPFSKLAKIGLHLTLPIRKWDDRGALFHTGGTTGAPKIAQLTHGNQIFISWAAATNRFMEENKSIFCGLPLFHVNGALITGLVSWMNGATVFLGPAQGFRTPGLIENFWSIIESHKIGAFSAVPAIFQKLSEIPADKYDISSIEFAICGAAPISKTTFKNFQSNTSILLLEGYGFTEGACISSISPGYGEQRVGSVGLKIPYQDITVFKELKNTGAFHPVETNQIGIIGVTGPNVFQGYLSSDDNQNIWIEWDGKKWYNTGDMGRLDQEGYLWLTGRKKDLIIRGGHNIDPMIIENGLICHPLIESVAAIGSPDPEVGEIPVAYVIVKEGKSLSVRDMLDFAQTVIPERAAIPKHIVIIDQMPLTTIGKIFKPALIEKELKRVLSGLLAKNLKNDNHKILISKDKKLGHQIYIRPSHTAWSNETYLRIKKILDQYALNINLQKNI
ncbi:acyl-CoA synthetase [Paremcibacter congregatus]|uniref:Acyl-CoA synthetase n=1 Tax=Paremcibacter congregatus TaxID=2043170 RepID=A0A2G4YQY7_9PROT|nr:acyl-CoA synthetase [Paremcibacter congregatus]PHZ83876.1 acyl-CoA synthetase [Paremcibacter congregatus]QDE27581.1 acyl-CoA synthetase [Paremcibacter congregatus]